MPLPASAPAAPGAPPPADTGAADTGPPDTGAADTGDTADTADTASTTDTACPVVEGGGCGAPAEQNQTCFDSPTPDLAEVYGDAQVEGDGCGCTSVPALPHTGVLAAVMLAAVTLRRWAPAVALAVCLAPRPAAAVDAQRLQTADGGTFLTMRQADFGNAWTPRLALSTSYTARPAVLVDDGDESPIVDRLLTTELGASVALDRWLRLGATLPVHASYEFLGEPAEPILGNPGLWVQIPLSDADAPTDWVWTVGYDIAQPAASDVLLADPGAVLGALTAAHTAGPWTFGVDAAVRLQQVTELPNLLWGNRFEYGIGAAWSPQPVLSMTAELMGGAPIRTGGGRSAWPLEALASARVCLSPQLDARLGGGAGLGRGVGAPAWRGVVRLEYAVDEARDRDRDGLADLRDRCPTEPEDFDGFEDRDGCPEPDNDRDRFLDADDTCPDEAEVYNDHEDADGCPDFLSAIDVIVRSSRPGRLDQAQVRLGGTTQTALAAEPTRFRVPPGLATLVVTAPQHHEFRAELPLLQPGPYPYEVLLDAYDAGTVMLRAVSAATRTPLAARLATPTESVPDASRAISAEGTVVDLEAGTHTLHLSAPGHQPAEVTVQVSADAQAQVEVPLAPLDIWLSANELILSEQPTFELDSAQLSPDSTAVLDRVAAWLRDHPGVQLVRVDGHADSIGSPRHNHTLSVSRAQAVVAHLVAAGIERDRLEPVGAGEALASGTDAAGDRSVSFLVVVWDEEAASPD